MRTQNEFMMLVWLPEEKESYFHREFFKQDGLNIKKICWEEKSPYLCGDKKRITWYERRK